MALCVFSLLEQNDHRIANVEADIASIVVGYGVASLLNDKAVPVALIPPVKLLLDLASDI